MKDVGSGSNNMEPSLTWTHSSMQAFMMALGTGISLNIYNMRMDLNQKVSIRGVGLVQLRVGITGWLS